MTDALTVTKTSSTEREILGSVLKDARLYPSIRFLEGTDFEEGDNGEIWKAMQDLASSGTDITVANLATYLPNWDRSAIDEMRGGSTANIDRVRGAALALADHRRRRLAVHVLQRGVEKILEEPERWTEFACRIANALLARAKPSTAMNTAEVSNLLAEGLRRRSAFEPLPTGLKFIDNHFNGGLAPGLYTIGGRTKTGKTTLTSTLSYNWDEAGVPHLVVTAERDPADVLRVKMARRMRLNSNELQFVIPGEKDVCRYVHHQNIHITKVRQEIMFHSLPKPAGHGIRAAIVDYWQMIGGADPREPSADFLRRSIGVLQQTAYDAGIPVIVLFQTNDASAGNREIQIAANASNVCLILHRDVGSPNAFFQMVCTNLCTENDIGSHTSPAMQLDREVGPHWCDPYTA